MSEQSIVDITAIAYLVAGVLFVLALRGLSSPESSQKGNYYGMIGMTIAVITTLANPEIVSYTWIFAAIFVGGGLGLIIASRIAMTAMPQLVAAFHSLVGLAAVFVAAAAFLLPLNFGIVDSMGNIYMASRIEMALGAAIGAITFSGSVIAFAKLNGNMSGAPIILPARHLMNIIITISIIIFIGFFSVDEISASGDGNIMSI